MSNTARIDAYCAALEALTPETLDGFLATCRDDIEFRDPFNHTYTRAHFRLALEDMFKHIEGLNFEILDKWGAGDSWVIKWRFTGSAKLVGRLDIVALSEVAFDADGLVQRHIDHWDGSGEFVQKIPVLGAMVARALRPLRVV